MSRLIQSDSAEEAVAELLETHCLSGSTLAIFDCHEVLGKDLHTSCAVVSDLNKCGIEVACLSFASRTPSLKHIQQCLGSANKQGQTSPSLCRQGQSVGCARIEVIGVRVTSYQRS